MAILKLDPYNCDACTRLAKYYKLNDNIAEAKNMYLKALEIDPDNRGAINNLNKMEKEQKEDDAIKQIQTIENLLREGQKAMRKDRHKRAVKLFEKAFGLEPSLKHAVSLADAYEKTGRYDKIEKIYRQLIDDNSKQHDIEAIEKEFKALRSNSNISYEKAGDNKT